MDAPDAARAVDLWRQARRLLPEALDRPPAERAAFLDAACDGDAALRAELEALVEAHEQAGAFLDGLDPDGAAALLSDADPAPVGETVGPYRIERELGRGGMGVVYLAEDPRLGRRVALKLVPPHLAADARARRRLVAEARAAAALEHPCVAAVHDIGEADDGRLYLAMAYAEGPTLRDRLAASPLPVAEAVAVARQLAEGLGAAHARGIVHRDVKPSNVVVAPGGAVTLVDFGVAKAAGGDLTREGTTPGTVAYMSPEQTRGEPADARSDLWSLGVVLYEMLTGARPFRGPGDASVIHAIRHDAPAPVRALRPEVPASLAAVVERCLEKEPGRRFSDAASLVAALGAGAGAPRRRRALRIGGALALGAALLAGGLAVWESTREAPTAGPTEHRLAVLPFADHSAEPADAYLASGLTEELTTRLATLSGLRVIAQSSSGRYRETDKGAAEIGAELGVGSLLTGSVRKDGRRVRIAVQLVDAAREEHRWAEAYDAALDDVLEVQHAIAAGVAEALDVEVRAAERQRLGKRGTDDPVAYDHYLKGRHLLHAWQPGPLEDARDHFQRALDLDPTFAGAWAGLGDVSVLSGFLGLITPQDADARGQAAAERALALDPDLAEAHSALAAALANDPHEWEAAEAHFRRALALDPSYALAHQDYAQLLRDQARYDEALAAIRQAQALDPLSPYAQLIEGVILWFAGRPADALAAFRHLLRVHGAYPAAHLFTGLVLVDMGEHGAALRALERADPGRSSPDALSTRARALAALGRRDEAEAVLAELEALGERRYVSPFLRALAYDALGAHDRVFPLLEQAYAERSWFVRILKTGPVPEGIRADPRYPALLAEVGLER